MPVNFDQQPSSHHDAELESVVGDLCDPEIARRALAGADVVVHLAALADVDAVTKDPGLTDRVNVGGTRVLLDAARELGVSRFVYASTIWVYGDAHGTDALDEDHGLQLPRHVYTATKIAGEMYVASYHSLYGIEYTILRFGIPYGPRSRPTAVVAAFTAKALAGEPLMIAGDGMQSRRFVYVEDLADGIVRALAPAAANRVYNLVGRENVSVRSIARTVRDLVGNVPIEHVEGRVGDLHGGNVSGERALAELGWEATTPFPEGVRRYVDWVNETGGTPTATIASRTAGSAAAVRAQDSAEL